MNPASLSVSNSTYSHSSSSIAPETNSDAKLILNLKIARKILEQEKRFLPDPSCYAITLRQYIQFRISDIFLARIDTLKLTQLGFFLFVQALIADSEEDPIANSENQLVMIKRILEELPELKDELLRLHLLAKQSELLRLPLKGILPLKFTEEELKGLKEISKDSLKFIVEKLLILWDKVGTSIQSSLDILNKKNNLTKDETKILPVNRAMRRKGIILIQESTIGKKRAQGKKILTTIFQKNQKNVFDNLKKINLLIDTGNNHQISHNLEHVCTQLASVKSLIRRHIDVMIEDYEGTNLQVVLKCLKFSIGHLLCTNGCNLIWLRMVITTTNEKKPNNPSDYIFTIDEELETAPSKVKKKSPKKSEGEEKAQYASIKEEEGKQEEEVKIATESIPLPSTSYLERQEQVFESLIETAQASLLKQESYLKLDVPQSLFSHFARCVETQLEKEDHQIALSSHLEPFFLRDLKLHQQEMRDHLFMAACGMELFVQAILETDFEALPAILTNLVLDFHVVVEQGDKAKLILQAQERYGSHHLVGLSQHLGDWSSLGTKSKQFREDLDLGLIWSRYPKTSLRYHESDQSAAPPILLLMNEIQDFVNELQKNKIKKFDNVFLNRLQTVIQTIFGLYDQHCCDLIQRSGQGALKKEIFERYQQTMIQLRDYLIGHLQIAHVRVEEKIKTDESPFKPVLGLLEKFSVSLDTFAAVLSTSGKELIGDPIIPLQEASQHLKRINGYLKRNASQPHLTAWDYRNILTVQWFFEQIYMALVSLKEVGYLKNEHDFKKYQELLSIEEQPSHLDQALLEFNLGKGIHYPRQTKVNGHITKLNKLLDHSKRFVGNPTGFVPSGMDKESLAKHLDYSSTLLDVISRAAHLCDCLVQDVLSTIQKQ